MPGRLKSFFNLLALNGLPGQSFEQIRDAGYDGVQFAAPASAEELETCRALDLEYAASGRVNVPDDVCELARQWADEGFVCATLHVGWGVEGSDEAARLIESILQAAAAYNFPLYVETHRATIFQDMWRTVGFIGRFPELRFNGDFSHWYTGQEMVYGGFEKKVRFIQPVIERVRFIHGRISNPGSIQVAVNYDESPEPEYVTHFRELWTDCFRAGADIFTPELLAPDIYYARTFRDAAGKPVEESDRWEQSLVLRRVAEECFAEAAR